MSLLVKQSGVFVFPLLGWFLVGLFVLFFGLVFLLGLCTFL